MNNIPLYDNTTFYLSIYSLFDAPLGCDYFLAVMNNNAAMNMCVQVLVWAYVFLYLGYISRIGIAGSYGDSMFEMLANKLLSHRF